MGVDEKDPPGTGNTTNIYKVSIKYSPFNRDDPEIWFTQLEAQFEIGGISVDATKYGHLIAALDPETVKCVRDKILTPPAIDKYNSLRSVIIERLCDSAKIKLDRLLSGLQLGDKKPSQLLREMETLSVNQITEPVLRNLWLQRLPTHAQEILSCMDDSNLVKLATAADKILDVNKPSVVYAVNAISNKNSQPNDLAIQVNALSKRVEELFSSFSKGHSKAPRGRSDSPASNFQRDNRNQRQRSRYRTKEQVDKHPNCWYHHKFGNKARKCLKPCKFDFGQTNSHNSGN